MMRIEEAIARARVQGRKVLKKDIAARLWPDSPESTRQVNFTKLLNGKTASVRPEWVKIICEMCGCSADYLMGLTNE